jgi:hypothetical protein
MTLITTNDDTLDHSVNPASVSLDKPTPIEQTTTMETDASVGLGLLFQQIIEASTDSSALKLRKNIAQSEFDRRLADFRGSEPIHEKFPATAESQARSRDRAERALRSISEEVQAKKSSLDDLASQAVAQFIPHMITASASYGRSESDARVEELEKKCKDFQEQLEVQHKFMLNLQKSHEESYRSLEDKHLKSRDDAAHDKAAMVGILKTLSKDLDAAREANAQVKEQIPQNLRPSLEKLDTLFERVDKFPNLRLDIDKIKQESGKSSNEFAKHIKNIEQLEGYYTKVNELSRAVHGTGSPYSKGLITTVADLATVRANETATTQAQATHKDRLDGAALDAKFYGIETRNAKLESRLRAVETHPSTPTEHLNTVALSRISSAEQQAQSLKQSISNMSDRFHIMSNEILATKKKMETLVERINSKDSSTDIEKSAVPAINFDTLKSEILKVVEEKQAAVDMVIHTIFTQLQADIKQSRIQLEHIEKRCSEMNKVYDPITAVPKQMEQLKATFKLGNVQLIADAAKNALDLIRSQPDLLPLATIESHVLKGVDIKLELVNKQHELLSQTLADKLEANTDGLRSLDRCFNNINTKNLAVFILSQLETIYPDLRNTQKSLGDIVESHRRQDIVLSNFSDAITSLKSKVDGLCEAQVSSQADEQAIHSLRGEVDKLTLNIGKIQGAAITARKAAETANENIAAIQNDYVKTQLDIATAMGKLRVDLEEVKDQQQPLCPVATSSHARYSAAIPSRSVSTSDAIRPPTSDPHGFSQRPATALGNQSHKKRKLNGTPPSQGATQGPKVANGTQRKRRRKYSTDIIQLDEDDSEDSTFEPNQPSISDLDE